MGMEAEVRCLELASRQYGLITRAQVIELGLSVRTFNWRRAHGVWESVLPGVYRASGSASSWHQEVMGACLWSGGTAYGLTAAGLWGFDGYAPGPVMVAGSADARRPPGSRLSYRWISDLGRQDRTALRGIPVTTPGRTLVDLAGLVGRTRLENAVDHVLRAERASVARIWGCLEAAPANAKGLRTLRKLLELRTPGFEAPDSVLEAELFRLVEAAGIRTRWRRHREVLDRGGRLIVEGDLVFEEERLVVLVDGFRWHGTRKAFDSDLELGNRLTEEGWRYVRVTSQHLHKNPRVVCERIKRLLRVTPEQRGRARQAG